MKKPPGPKGHWLFGCLPELQRDPLQLLYANFRTYGDIVHFPFGPRSCYLLAHPDDIQSILRDQCHRYTRQTRGYQFMRKIMGEGILTSEGRLWQKQRAQAKVDFSLQFDLDRLESTVAIMNQELSHWQSCINQEEPIDLIQKIAVIIFSVFDKIYLEAQMSDAELLEVLDGGHFMEEMISYQARHIFHIPLWVPTSNNRKYQKVRRKFRDILSRIAEYHLSQEPESGNIIRQLVHHHLKQENSPQRRAVLFHEISAFYSTAQATVIGLSVSYTLYLLLQHAQILVHVKEEIEKVLNGRLPTVHDLSKLTFLEQVLKEGMRLYPPVWQLTRLAEERDMIRSYVVPKNTVITMSAYVTHRHPDFWEEPETFCPDRFSSAEEKKRHRFSYFPFGGGPHHCLGQHVAMMNAKLILAMLLQRFSFQLSSSKNMELNPLFSLFPKGPLRVRIQPL